jgi:DNA-binding CsgD family transcriptional regulator
MGMPQMSFSADEDFKCPNCGVLESEGGCENPRVCAEAIARMDEQFAREITDLLDRHSSNRPFHLLMAGFEALELLNIGLALTNLSGQVLLANRIAEKLLASRDGIALTSHGVLRTLRDSQPSLPELIQQAASCTLPRKPESIEAMLAIQRPSGKRPLTLLVRSAKRSALGADSTGPAALVFILDPELPVQAAEPELRQLYGFTATETRLANLLMEGKTLEECCEELGVRRPTVCSHLQHLFRKTGVQRQSELVSLLFKSIGLIRTGTMDPRVRSGASSLTFKDACVKMLQARRSSAQSEPGLRT